MRPLGGVHPGYQLPVSQVAYLKKNGSQCPYLPCCSHGVSSTCLTRFFVMRSALELRVPPLCNSGVSCSSRTMRTTFRYFVSALLFTLTLLRLWSPFREVVATADTSAFNIKRLKRKSPILSSLFTDGIIYFFLVFGESAKGVLQMLHN